MNTVRSAIAAASALSATVLALLLTGCGTSAPTTPAPAATPAPIAASTAPATTSAAASGTQRIEARYAGGQIVGGASTTPVPLGSTVELVVTSDVADEVHVHGYEKKAEVPAGGTVTISFVANIPGVFEVELENKGVQLTKLRVS